MALGKLLIVAAALAVTAGGMTHAQTAALSPNKAPEGSAPVRIEHVPIGSLLGQTEGEIQRSFGSPYPELTAETPHGVMTVYAIRRESPGRPGMCDNGYGWLLFEPKTPPVLVPIFLVFMDGRLRYVLSNKGLPLFTAAADRLPLEDQGQEALARIAASALPADQMVSYSVCPAPERRANHVAPSPQPATPAPKAAPASRLTAGDAALGVALSPVILPLYALAREAEWESGNRSQKEATKRIEATDLWQRLNVGASTGESADALQREHPDLVRTVARDGDYSIILVTAGKWAGWHQLIGMRRDRVEWIGGLSWDPDICVQADGKQIRNTKFCNKYGTFSP